MITIVNTKLADPSKEISRETHSTAEALRYFVEIYLLGRIPSLKESFYNGINNPLSFEVFSGKLGMTTMNFYAQRYEDGRPLLTALKMLCALEVELNNNTRAPILSPREYHFIPQVWGADCPGNVVLCATKKKSIWLTFINPTSKQMNALDRMSNEMLATLALNRLLKDMNDGALTVLCDAYLEPPTIVNRG